MRFKMRNKKRKKRTGISRFMMLLLIAVSVLSLWGNSRTVFADPDDGDDDTDTTELERQREENESRLDEINATIEELAAEQEGVEEEIEEITAALTEVMADIEDLNQRIDIKEGEIAEAQVSYDAAVAEEEAQYEAMKIRIKYMYEKGDSSYVQLFAEARSFSELLTKADYIEDLYEYDRRMLAKYKETVEMVAALQEQLEKEKNELVVLEANAEEEKAYMEGIQEDLEATSAEYARQILSAENQAVEYETLIAAQNAEINRRKAEAERRAREEAERRAREEAERQAALAAAANAADSEAARERALSEVADAESSKKVSNSNGTFDVSSIYSANGSSLGKSVAVYACKFIGNPYVYGGTSLTNGTDCSGFVYSVYKEFGYNVPRTSFDQRTAGKEVSYSEAQPGDIICYAGHVAIYIGNGMIVHASTPSTGIKVSNALYRDYICIRRIV
ncbi:MAG: C40 family peptidase [Lachnospiraceae bacterium]|nr:C40 family peptidase [Lachnospiraceae bacterium]